MLRVLLAGRLRDHGRQLERGRLALAASTVDLRELEAAELGVGQRDDALATRVERVGVRALEDRRPKVLLLRLRDASQEL